MGVKAYLSKIRIKGKVMRCYLSAASATVISEPQGRLCDQIQEGEEPGEEATQ